MPRHFFSVLRIVSQQEQQQDEKTSTLTICGDGKSVTLPKEHAEKPFAFDRVYFAADDNTVIYKGSVKEIVEGSLLGYHGTIISTGEYGLECSDTLLSSTKHSPGVILKAADHIFLCIKRSKSRTGSSLVVLCSYLSVINEKVYDLLHNYGNTSPASGDFPLVACKQGQLSGQSAFAAKNSAAILKFLRHGKDALKKLKEELSSKEKNILWHTIFTITVEHAQFGAQFAPVSGTLSFVQLSSSQQQVPSNINSYGSFVMVIDQLANMKLDLKSVNKRPDYQKSVLTEILKESLGGNCKTVLITHVNFTIHHPDRVLSVLGVGSKACAVHNQPNKRDLAEQALMTAYMKELRQIYGDVSAHDSEEGLPLDQSLQVPNFENAKEGSLKDVSQTSVLTAEIDNTYDELMKDIDDTGKGGGAPKRFVEMAASALAEAALEGDESSSEGDDDTEEDVNLTADQEPCSSKTFVGVPKKDKGKDKKRRRSSDSLMTTSGSSISNIPNTEDILASSYLSIQGHSEGDRSIYEALAAILQDPDRGAHRAQDRKNIKNRKDVGALFSGADIVQWMLDNLAGLTTSEEAEKLGQLLLDQNAILHSEGSRIFANAKSLFYYVHRPRAAGKMLSQEQVAALLAQAEGRSDPHVTEVTIVEKLPSSVSQNNMSVAAATSISPVKVEQKEYPMQDVVKRSLVKETSLVEPVMKKLSRDSGSASDGTDDKVSDVIELPNSGISNKPVEEQEVDHMIQQQDLHQQGPVDKQQQDNYQPTELTEFAQETTLQQEMAQKTTNSTTSLTDRRAPSNTILTHINSTSKMRNTQQISQASVLEELKLRGAGTSSSSLQPIPRRNRVTPWTRAAGQQQPDSWSHDDHVTSKSSVMDHLQPYDEEKESLPDDEYLDVPNVAMTTNSAEIEDFDNVEDYPTPLHMAAVLGKGEGVIANLSMMCAVDNEDSNGRTPLMYATIKNKVRSCQALISCGAKVNQLDHTGSTALHYAAYLGYCNVIALLLSKKAIPFLKDSQGQTALHLATVLASPTAVQIILKSAGIKLIAEEDNHKLTPIHWAIAYNKAEQLKMMIKSISDPTKLDSCGRSLLNYSITCNATECTHLLTSLYPSLMGVADIKGFLPVHVASMQESPAHLTVLLQVNTASTNKCQRHLDLNATDSEGKTALHWSVFYSQKDITELLLKHGASKNVKDQEGLTPLDACQQHGDDGDIAKLLQQGDLPHTEETTPHKKQHRSRLCILL